MANTRKRSAHVSLALLGAAAFGLSACREEGVETLVVRDIASCMDLGGYTQAECEAADAEAQAQNRETAPRYDALAVCEEQHGVGACEQEVTTTGQGGGSIFLPILAGYMMGRMLSGGGLASKPLYPTAGGQVATADGRTAFNKVGGKGVVSPAGFQAAPNTRQMAPMSKAQVDQRGGFGAARTAAPGAGTLGG